MCISLFIFMNIILQLKHERDRLRYENERLRAQQGFVNSKGLVKDFESRKHDLLKMENRVQDLKTQYSFLTQQAKAKSMTSQYFENIYCCIQFIHFSGTTSIVLNKHIKIKNISCNEQKKKNQYKSL